MSAETTVHVLRMPGRDHVLPVPTWHCPTPTLGETEAQKRTDGFSSTQAKNHHEREVESKKPISQA